MTNWAKDAIGHGCFAIDEKGDIVAFHPSIRDALVARGDLSCRDGIWHLKGSTGHVETQTPWLAICDFCSSRPVTWDIPCESFKMPDLGPGDTTTHMSRGGWAACETCGALIDTVQKEQLLTRALKHLTYGHISSPYIKQLHRQFWKHYQGGATRIPARPFGQ